MGNSDFDLQTAGILNEKSSQYSLGGFYFPEDLGASGGKFAPGFLNVVRGEPDMVNAYLSGGVHELQAFLAIHLHKPKGVSLRAPAFGTYLSGEEFPVKLQRFLVLWAVNCNVFQTKFHIPPLRSGKKFDPCLVDPKFGQLVAARTASMFGHMENSTDLAALDFLPHEDDRVCQGAGISFGDPAGDQVFENIFFGCRQKHRDDAVVLIGGLLNEVPIFPDGDQNFRGRDVEILVNRAGVDFVKEMELDGFHSGTRGFHTVNHHTAAAQSKLEIKEGGSVPEFLVVCRLPGPAKVPISISAFLEVGHFPSIGVLVAVGHGQHTVLFPPCGVPGSRVVLPGFHLPAKQSLRIPPVLLGISAAVHVEENASSPFLESRTAGRGPCAG